MKLITVTNNLATILMITIPNGNTATTNNHSLCYISSRKLIYLISSHYRITNGINSTTEDC